MHVIYKKKLNLIILIRLLN